MSTIKQAAISALAGASIAGALFCVYEGAQAMRHHDLNPYRHGSSSTINYSGNTKVLATPSSMYCTNDHPYPPVGGMCTYIGFAIGQYCNPGLDCPGLNGGANGGFPPQYTAVPPRPTHYPY